MDDLVIIEKRKLNNLMFRSDMMALGWVLAIAILILMAVVVHVAKNTINELRQIQYQQREVNELQQKTTSSFIDAWEQQQEGIRTIVTWSEYIKEREDMSKYNRSSDKLPAYTATLGRK